MKKWQILIVILFIVVVGMISVTSIDTNELDEICSEDGKSLVRTMGVWDCGVASSGSVGSGNVTINNYTNNLTFNYTYNITNNVTSNDGNNYTTSINVTGTSLKMLNLSRNGMVDLSAYWTDYDTDTDDQTCAEVSGCVIGAITDGNTGWDNIYDLITLADALVGLGNWSQENSTIRSLINAKASQSDMTNLSGNDTNRVRMSDLIIQNSTYYTTWWKLTDVTTQNNSYYTTFGKQTDLTNLSGNVTNKVTNSVLYGLGYYNALQNLSLNNTHVHALQNLTGTTSSTACTGTDKVTQATLNNGVLTTTCAADQTGGAGGVDMTTLSSNSTGLELVNSTWTNLTINYVKWDNSHSHKVANISDFATHSPFSNNTINTTSTLPVVSTTSLYSISAGQSNLFLTGTSARVYYEETDDNDWSMLVSGGQFYFKEETGTNEFFNVRGDNNIDALSVDLAGRLVIVNQSLIVGILNAANCDVKAYTNGTLYCGTDATGSGGSTQFNNDTQNLTGNNYNIRTNLHFLQHDVPLRDYNAWMCDFVLTTYGATTTCLPDYTGVVTGTGGISAAVATSLNRTVGLYSISKGTVANSGYRWVMSPAMFLMQGNEAFTTKLSLAAPIGVNLTLGILGFCDATTITTTCADGMYFNITANASHSRIIGNTAVNSVILRTATNYNITMGINTFYTYKVFAVNQTLVNFSIYDDNQLLVWSDTISNTAALPITAGRETGSGVWLGTSGAGAAAAIISKIDYMLTEVESALRWIP